MAKTQLARTRMPTAKTVQVKVRMPVFVHRKLLGDAERSGQTLNAEILRRLAGSFRIEKRMDEIAAKFEEFNAIMNVIGAGMTGSSEQEWRDRADKLRTSTSTSSTDKAND